MKLHFGPAIRVQIYRQHPKSIAYILGRVRDAPAHLDDCNTTGP